MIERYLSLPIMILDPDCVRSEPLVECEHLAVVFDDKMSTLFQFRSQSLYLLFGGLIEFRAITDGLPQCEHLWSEIVFGAVLDYISVLF
jgi:hypothetical protein